MDAIRQHFRSIRQSDTETYRTGSTQQRWTEADDNNEGDGEWGSCRSIYNHLGASFLISWVIQMYFRLDPCNTLTKNGKSLPARRKSYQRQNNAGVRVTLPVVGKVLWFGLLVLCLVETYVSRLQRAAAVRSSTMAPTALGINRLYRSNSLTLSQMPSCLYRSPLI
jgi:hypothetical protein